MSRMKKPNESSHQNSSRRAEQRLHYRWPVRFTINPEQQQPFSGQLVDVSSRGMAMLFHADKSCPRLGQSVTADFGVPYFDSHDSFDTVLFRRAGLVCRVDNLNSRVNRVALQFADPLFFKPGEQNISDTDAQQRLEAKFRSVARASQSPACDTAPARAGSNVTAEAKLKTKAGKKTQAGVDKAVKAKIGTRQQVLACSDQIAKVKAQAAKEITRITTEAEEAIARIEANFTSEAAGDRTRGRSSRKKDAGHDAGQSQERGLMKKVETFFSDRSTVF